MPSRVKRAYADTAEGQVHYRSCGAGNPLILMHWCPGNGRQYEHVLPLFAERGFGAYAPDLIGYGDSDKPDRSWSISDYALNLEHFMDRVGLDRAYLVGGHTSAAVVAELAVSHPARALKLVLDGAPAWDKAEREQKAGTHAPPMQLTAAGGQMLWAWKRSYRNESMPLDRVFFAALDLLKAGPTYHVGYEAVYAYDMRSCLPLVTVPFLLTTGREDRLFQVHRQAMALAPKANEHIFPGTHALTDPDRAEEYVDVVAAFLQAA